MYKRQIFENDLSEINNLHEELVIELMGGVFDRKKVKAAIRNAASKVGKKPHH